MRLALFVAVALAVADLAADEAGPVERRVDVPVGVSLANRANELRHLTGCDSLPGRPDDVSCVDDTLDRALEWRARRLVAAPTEECADATCYAGLSEMDMREERAALRRLEVLVMEPVADFVARDPESQVTVTRRRLRRSLLEPGQAGLEVVAALPLAPVGERGRGQGHRR